MEAHAGAFKETSHISLGCKLVAVQYLVYVNDPLIVVFVRSLSSLGRHLTINVEKILISALFHKIPTSSILPLLSFF